LIYFISRNWETTMATVSFSIPEAVKKRFDRAFAGKNKSRVIADLMSQAVEEQLVQKRRSEAIDALLGRRRSRLPMSMRDLRRARESGRL